MWHLCLLRLCVCVCVLAWQLLMYLCLSLCCQVDMVRERGVWLEGGKYTLLQLPAALLWHHFWHLFSLCGHRLFGVLVGGKLL